MVGSDGLAKFVLRPTDFIFLSFLKETEKLIWNEEHGMTQQGH